MSDAVILLNKPSGITSFAAVRKCRAIFNEKKGGHTGTLDPEASGLVIVLLGRYTKLLPYCVKDHKKYHAEFCFGLQTDTDDIYGQVIAEQEPREHGQEELNNLAISFTGHLLQKPPMYSAVKINGRKLYEYARKGQFIERPRRDITVYDLKITKTGDNLYEMTADVSSGTYIRTLIADLSAALGELGTMKSLVRTAIGCLSITDAADFDELSGGKGVINPLKVIDPSFEIMPCDDVKAVINGRPVIPKDDQKRIIFVKDDMILAAYELRDDGFLHCLRGLF